MFASHVKQNHLGGLEECIPYVPERPTAEQGDFLRSWKFLQGPDVVDTQKKKIQDDVMRKLIQLNDNKVLPRYFVENMMKGCNRDNDSGQLGKWHYSMIRRFTLWQAVYSWFNGRHLFWLMRRAARMYMLLWRGP